MAQDISTDDAFARDLLAKAEAHAGPDEPRAFYNVDGDCIEIYFSNANHHAVRLNEHMTVFLERESDKIVGVLLKGVHELVRELVRDYPGFQLEIRNRKIRVAYLLTAVLWKNKESKPRIELQIRELREDIPDLEVELQSSC